MQLPIEIYVQQQLASREQEGNKRALIIPHDGVDFYSNDYLGLASSKQINKATKSCSHGSTGSRLLSGNSLKAMQLEDFLASFHEAAASLLFNSGYDANLSLLSAIANRHTTFLYDEHCHASMIDGMRLSQAKHKFKFPHNDLGKLAALLKKFHHKDAPIIVLVESIYSMQGDAAPLKELVALCTEYSAALIVDEAHATGLFGHQGRGLVHALGLQQKVFARIITFGKALGSHGGAVIGSAALKAFLINFGRSFIYSTAPSEAETMAIWAGYERLMAEPERKEKVEQNIAYFNACKQKCTLNWLDSQSPIQSLVIGNSEEVKAVKQKCLKDGLLVGGILSPTVAKGAERLRICLHAFNNKTQINHLFNTIKQCLNK